MKPKLLRRVNYALNYVANMTYIGPDTEWYFKPNYNPQIILDAISFIADPAKLEIVKTHTLICPKCAKEVEFDYIQNRGIMPSADYEIIADSIFHSECWKEQVEQTFK